MPGESRNLGNNPSLNQGEAMHVRSSQQSHHIQEENVCFVFSLVGTIVAVCLL